MRTAQQRPDAGEQLGEAERLGHVVVGAGIEADHQVDLVGTRGEDQDRCRQTLVADLTCDVQAVHVREAQIQDHDVDTARGVDRSLTSSMHDHVVTLPRQRTRQRFGNRRVVLR
ncbi:hypothetical protein D3C74_399690 [compost metagenome]